MLKRKKRERLFLKKFRIIYGEDRTSDPPIIPLENDYSGDISNLPHFDPSIKGYISKVRPKYPAETIFTPQIIGNPIQIPPRTKEKIKKNIRKLIDKLEEKAVCEGRTKKSDLRLISDEFIGVMVEDIILLNEKYVAEANICKPQHKEGCVCNLCFELIILNKLLNSRSLGAIFTSYFYYIHSTRINIDKLIFNPKDVDRENLEVLFRKIERKFKRLKDGSIMGSVFDFAERNHKRFDMTGSIHRIGNFQGISINTYKIRRVK